MLASDSNIPLFPLNVVLFPGMMLPLGTTAHITAVEHLKEGRMNLIVKRYIDHLADASGEDLSDATLPTDPTALAFLAGTAIQGPLADRQRLLSARSLRALIANTVSMLDREDQILTYMLRAYQSHQEVQRLPFVDYSLN